MSNALSPELLASLVQRGLIDPRAVPGAATSVQPPAPVASPVPPPTTGLQALLTQIRHRNGQNAPFTPPEREAPTPHAPPAGPVDPAGVVNATQGGAAAAPAGGAGQADTTIPSMGAGGVAPAHSISRVSPETRGMYDTASDEQRGAAAAGAQADVSANEGSADALTRLADDAGQARSVMDAADFARNKERESRQAKYDQYRADAASGQPDYDRWWKSRSGGQKALAVFAQALGAWRPGTNDAAQIINGFIGRDIEEQKDAQGRKERAAGADGDALGQFDRNTQAQQVERSRAYADQLERFKMLAEAETKRSQSPILRAKGAQIIAGLDQEQAKIHDANEKYVAAQATGGVDANWVRNTAKQMILDSKGTLSDTEALARAMRLYRMQSGDGGEWQTRTEKPGSGGKISPRIAQGIAGGEANAAEADELRTLTSHPYLSQAQQARAEYLAKHLEANGVQVPQSSGFLSRAMGGPAAAAEQAAKGQRDRVKRLKGIAAGGTDESDAEAEANDLVK